MRNLAASLFLCFLLDGCTVRRTPVYEAEIRLSDRMVVVASTAVRRVLLEDCSCADGGVYTARRPPMTDERCTELGQWYAVYTRRWPWHVERMRRREGGEVPAVPPACYESNQ